MPVVPLIDPNNLPSLSINQVSADGAPVSDKRNAAKATKYQRLESILDKQHTQYQQRADRQERVMRQLTAQQEELNATKYGQQALQQLVGKSDDEAVPFVHGEFDKIYQDAYKRHGNDPELWGEISLRIQREAFTTETAAFNFVQKRKADTAQAALIEQEQLIKSLALSEDNENAVDMRIQQFSDTLASTVDAGFISKEAAAKTNIDFASNIYTARVQRMMINGNFDAAENYLAAKSDYVGLETQIRLESAIASGRDLAKKKNIKKNLDEFNAKSSAFVTSKYDPGLLAVQTGAVNTTEIFFQTGGRAVLPNESIDNLVNGLDQAETGDDFLSIILSARQQFAPDKDMAKTLDDQMRERTAKPSLLFAHELANSGAKPQLNAMLKLNSEKEAAAINALAKAKEVDDTEIASSVSSAAPNYYQWLSRYKSPDYVDAYRRSQIGLAKYKKITSDGASYEDAAKFATDGTASKYNVISSNGIFTMSPVSPNLNAEAISRGLEDYRRELRDKNMLDILSYENTYWDLSPDDGQYYLRDKRDNTFRATEDGKAKITMDPVAANLRGVIKTAPVKEKGLDEEAPPWGGV